MGKGSEEEEMTPADAGGRSEEETYEDENEDDEDDEDGED